MKWFKHMCDASENDFLTRLEDEFGLEGYARWFKLCEAVGHGADPKKDKWSVAHPWSKWQTILKGKRKKLETFLEHSEIVSRTNQKLIGNILEIEILKLKELKDNYAKDLQAAGNSPRALVLEAEEEVDKKKNSNLKVTCPQAKPDGPESCPHQEIINLYHQVLPELNQVREWTPARQQLLRSRWRESVDRQKVDWWKGFFEYVRTCPLLMGLIDGRDGGTPFQADLEWLVRPKNFVKVIEGKYEPRI